ncbi:RepB family plasmid replication initiator protein, partial [Gigaspora margarita]
MDSRASCEGINREGRLADRVDTAQVRPQGHRTTFRIPARSAREVAGLKCARTFSRSIAAKKPSSLVASAMTFHATR